MTHPRRGAALRPSGRIIATLASCGALAAGLAACGDDSNDATGSDSAADNLSGTIQIDGSSTVAPLSEAAAELFQEANPEVRVTVGTSGTGGGFEKFCRGESDISNASRQIKDDESKTCKAAGIDFEELSVANDGLSVIVNPENDWADCLTVEEVSKIWDKGSKVDNWSQVRSGFPDQKLELYGPGTDSGTFDYFTEAINGEEGQQRTNYNNIGEDDNASITGVSGDKGASGYLGFSFFSENSDKVKAVPIRGEGGECVGPSEQTVQDGSYEPLGRQLFVYPSGKALARPEVEAFLEFYIDNNAEIAKRAALIALTDEQKAEAKTKVDKLVAAAGGGSEPGATETAPE
ncbi:MAG: PstS family phosphate ABC transporter substrate-binding protein [Solirubrobacteraceae bacterium]